MRPLRLELEGFTSFRKRTVVPFEDTDLFVLTGATGSGKSSLIDAMVFALYGSVPRYDNRNLVAPVVSQGMVQGRVRLDFEAGGREYTAVRVVRRTPSGGGTTKEATLEERAGGEASRTLARTADEVTACVAEHGHRTGPRPLHKVRCAAAGRVRDLHARKAPRAPGSARAASGSGALRTAAPAGEPARA